MLEAFERYATSAGAQVWPVGSEAAATEIIADAASGIIICTAAVRDAYPRLYALLQEATERVAVAEEIAAETGPGRSEIAAALAGGTGVIVASAGVAETGSLVVADDGLAPRLLSMLSEICIALLPSSAVLPSLDEAGELLAELNGAGHRYVSMITGPSRTADIERVLTIGVQGPKALHIILLSEEGS